MAPATRWRFKWRNFRGYESSPSIEFPSLTVLIGRNNVGKTSAYSPLLLLRQTLEAKSPSTALLFRGSAIDFGSYEDVVTDHDVGREISFSLDFGVEDRSGLAPLQEPRSLRVTFESADDDTAQLTRSTVLDSEDRPIVTRSRESDGAFRLTSDLLPVAAPGRPKHDISELRAGLRAEMPNGFLFTGAAGLDLPDRLLRDEGRWKHLRDWYLASRNLFRTYSAINRQVRMGLRGIAYLGPIRSAPKRSYLLSAETPSTVGTRGEWATEVLYRNQAHGDGDKLDSVNIWLRKLGYGTLRFQPFGEYFRAYVAKTHSSVAVNFADCGMGLAQLLPILVQETELGVGECLIVQQPEIHLNPAQQDLITDFLIGIASSGRRVIIETHSEHVLTRIRRRIAEGETLSESDVALYYCDSKQDRSTIDEIDIGEFGEIQKNTWPAGFFGEQLENSVGLALAQSRRKSPPVAK